MRDQVPQQIAAAEIPPAIAQGMSSGEALSTEQLTAVGDLGQSILASVPDAFRAQVEPLIPAIVHAIYEAFSLAVANTFLVGIVAAIVAAGVVLLLRETPEPAVVAEREAMAAAGADAMSGTSREATAASVGPLHTEQVGERPE
jgi:hypothetical protein